MKIVLDTNCVLNIIFPESYYRGVWDAFRQEKYILCVTNEIISEYREIIERRTGNALFADVVIRAILSMPNLEKVEPTYRFNLITADSDDNKYVDCAITCGATFVVSNDKHFDVLDTIEWPKVVRLKLPEFASLICNP